MFSQVVGQQEVKTLLMRQVKENRIPHALLFSGPEGCGKFATAFAFAQYLLCQHPNEDDVCGICPACHQTLKLEHPDLNFSYPVIVKKSGSTTSETYIQEWKTLVRDSFYFGLNDWQEQMAEGSKQAVIPEAEGDRILEKMSLSAYEGGYKVMIIWKAERLNTSAANNLLKMLEEPAAQTIFILISEHPENILETIRSRTQQVQFRPLNTTEIATALMERNGLDRSNALRIARVSGGSYLAALRVLHTSSDEDQFFDTFVSLMRMSYLCDVRGLQKWSDEIAQSHRDRQKDFLAYCLNMVRENYIYNFQQPELNFMTDKEEAFAKNFSRFINERNVKDFIEEFSKASRDVDQNVGGKTIFFDLALRVIILIKK